MIVKITKCSNPSFWYAGLIGQSFTVEDQSFTDTDGVRKYLVLPSPGCDPFHLINVEDTKVVLS